MSDKGTDAFRVGSAQRWATFTATAWDYGPSVKPRWRDRWNCWRSRHCWSDMRFVRTLAITGETATEVRIPKRWCLFCTRTLVGDEATLPAFDARAPLSTEEPG